MSDAKIILTPEHIAEIKALAEKATPGPWESDGMAVPFHPKQSSPFEDQGASVDPVIIGGCQDEQGGAVGVLRNDDAAYIAACDPQTVLALIARIEELERENAALEAQVEALKGGGGEPRTISIKAASLEAARKMRLRCIEKVAEILVGRGLLTTAVLEALAALPLEDEA